MTRKLKVESVKNEEKQQCKSIYYGLLHLGGETRAGLLLSFYLLEEVYHLDHFIPVLIHVRFRFPHHVDQRRVHFFVHGNVD